MRSRILTLLILSFLVALAVASSAVARNERRSTIPVLLKGSPNSFGCKVLRSALRGNPIGARLTRFVPSGPNACVSQSGGDVPWRALLDLGLGSKHARAACKVLLADRSLTGSLRLTKAQSGADMACSGDSVGDVTVSDTVYFDKGRWSGILGIEGPTGGVTGSIPLLLRRVTAQLPR